jgi:hypothetical protein
MAAIYEDNFGFWEIDCPEEHAFLSSLRQLSRECHWALRVHTTWSLCPQISVPQMRGLLRREQHASDTLKAAPTSQVTG